jgi:hypothetical protein
MARMGDKTNSIGITPSLRGVIVRLGSLEGKLAAPMPCVSQIARGTLSRNIIDGLPRLDARAKLKSASFVICRVEGVACDSVRP